MLAVYFELLFLWFPSFPLLLLQFNSIQLPAIQSFSFLFSFQKKKKEEKEDSSCFHSHSLGLKFIRSILLCGISILHLATPDDDADDDKNENRKMALKLFNVSADPRRKTKTKIDNQLKRNVFGT